MTNKDNKGERKKMNNLDIRKALKDNDVKHYELAKKLGIHEATLCAHLRWELSPAEKDTMLHAIQEIAAEKEW